MSESTVPTRVNRHESPAAWREVDGYFADALDLEDDALVAARTSSAHTTLPNAEVSSPQGAFLGLIAQISGARRVLEFGTLAGYSAIWFARGVGPEGRVVTLELEEHNAKIARENFVAAQVDDRVDVIVGPAADSAQRLIDDNAAPFDLVFIDADKPSNPRYLAAALQLTRPGAIIIIDNVVRNGAVVEADSEDEYIRGIRQVVSDIAAHPELEATTLQTVGIKGWDGMIIARRK